MEGKFNILEIQLYVIFGVPTVNLNETLIEGSLVFTVIMISWMSLIDYLLLKEIIGEKWRSYAEWWHSDDVDDHVIIERVINSHMNMMIKYHVYQVLG